MFIHFSEEVQKILKNAKNEMIELKHPFIGSEHVLLSILRKKNIISERLSKYNINYDLFRNEIIKKVGLGSSSNNYYIYTPLLKRVLENAIIDAKEKGLNEVDINTLFNSLVEEGEGVAIRILSSFDIDINKLYNDNNQFSKKTKQKKLVINECSVDLTKKCKEEKIDPLIGREREVEEIISILLRRNKSNPLLIGEAGVGKTAIVEEIANRIIKGNVPEKLLNKRILCLSMASAVAGTKYRGEFEEKITKMLNELEKNDDIIVFIDEIHTLVGAGGAEGAIDASNILKPALARGNIRVIGATTIKEYKETICKDKALNRRFQSVFINENTKDETINILKQIKGIYEEFHQVKINDEVINLIVNLADKYITDKCNPDKSIDILDMVCTKVSLKKSKKNNMLIKYKKDLRCLKSEKNDLIIHHRFSEASELKRKELEIVSKINTLSLNLHQEKKKEIRLKDIKEVIESKTKIPIYEIQDKKMHIDIEKYLKNKIIGQDNIIDIISKVTKKILLGFKNDLPFSFLFVGGSGVGKTELVNEYSNYLKIPLIRLDMSEYKEAHTISKIIGSPPGYVGYNDFDTILEKVKNNPCCVLLLDEVEKACSEVLNLFLQVLDDGVITDSHGNKVNLRNTIIIMTSNIGSKMESIGFNNQNKNSIEIRNILSTALVNRINTICYFNKLNKDNIKLILNRKLKEIKHNYLQKNIKVNINNQDIDQIISKCEYEIYGVRKALKLLEEKVDDEIINSFVNCKKTIYNKKHCTL